MNVQSRIEDVLAPLGIDVGFSATHLPTGQTVARSCPIAWCSSDVVVVLFGRAGRLCQAAMTGNLTKGSSLIGAMVSRET
jgi:hypothetical protein